MSPHLLLQMFWVIAPLILADYEIENSQFLQEFFVTEEFKKKVYMLSRRDRPIDKEAAKRVCRQNGGYLAKLDGGMEEFDHLKFSVLEGSLFASGFLIDEVGKDIHPRIDYLDDLTGETCFFIREMSSTNYFAVFGPSPCHYKAKFICEMSVTESNDGSATGSTNFLQKFRISPVYEGKMYLFSKEFEKFNYVNAMNTCQLYGGYLLRLKDRSEQSLIERLLNNFIKVKARTLFYTSGNRRRNPEKYVWGESFEEINTGSNGIQWGRHEPNGIWECMAIWYSDRQTYELGNWDCNAGHTGFYVCEFDLQPL